MKVKHYGVMLEDSPTRVYVQIGRDNERLRAGVSVFQDDDLRLRLSEKEWAEAKLLIDAVFKKVAMAERGSN